MRVPFPASAGFDRPTSDEIQAARNGVVQLVLIPLRLSIVLAFRLGTMPWSDAPYAIGRLPHQEQREALPASPLLAEGIAPGTALALHIHLVDTSTNVIRGLRLVTFSTGQTHRLAELLREQAEQPWNPIAEMQEQDALYAGWSSDRLRDHPDAIL